MSEYILEARDIRKSFGGIKALNGVSIRLRAGEVHCLAGENGCGKSTLIKIVSGVYTFDGGELIIGGKTYDRISPDESINEGIQVIYQDLSLFPNLSVMENLAYNSEIMDRRKLVDYRRMLGIARRAMERIGHQMDLNAIVSTLSIADRQLIAIARAMLGNAKLIIMDEPTAALNKREVGKLFELVHKLTASGVAILFVSHKLDEVFEISKEYTILRNGENVAQGLTAGLEHDAFIYHMTGRRLDNKRFVPERSGDVLLETRRIGLTGFYRDVSFSVRSGNILGITGLMGSGRRELSLSLFGIMTVDSGDIYISGKKRRIRSVADAYRAGIGYVPEDRLSEGLFASQPVYRNITIANLGRLFLKKMFIDKRKLKSVSRQWVDTLNILHNRHELPAQTLSGGNQQKVVLGRWLQNQPKILILNGPTVGVDIGAKYDIHELLRKLARDGMAVLVVTDDLREIKSVCSDVLIMRNGRVSRTYNLSGLCDEELAALDLSAESEVTGA